MKKNILMALGAIFIIGQLAGCVVYDRDYGDHHYYRGWGWRHYDRD